MNNLNKFVDGPNFPQWDQAQNGGTQYGFASQYDKAGRLTQWKKNDPGGDDSLQWNWRFDKAGNRLSEQIADIADVQRSAYTVNDRDQVTSTVSGGPLHVSGHLDREGLLDDYDATDEPTEANGSFSAWFDAPETGLATIVAHDFSGHSDSTQVGPTVIHRPTRVFEYDANGNMTKITETPFGGGTAVEADYEWNANNRLVAVETGYTGHYYHQASGLYLAPYRTYNPKIDRWLSREPSGADGPNLYHYAFNNPVNIYDPTGLAGEWIWDPGFYVDLPYYWGDTVRNMFTDGWINGSLNGQITRYIPSQSQNAARNTMWGSLGVSGTAAGTACAIGTIEFAYAGNASFKILGPSLGKNGGRLIGINNLNLWKGIPWRTDWHPLIKGGSKILHINPLNVGTWWRGRHWPINPWGWF